MKENYLEILLLLLIVVVGIQGYYLYDLNSTLKDRQISEQVGGSLLIPEIRSFNGVFDKNTDPFMEMERLRQEMENSFMDFENLFQTTPSLNQFSSRLYRIPRLDLKEEDSKYIVTMEVPGIDKNAIDIKIVKGRLIVSAKVSEEKDNNTTAYYRHERRTSSYKRVVKLPSDADENSLQSSYKDGLLTITFDKKIS
jgi:HSP20 family protein